MIPCSCTTALRVTEKTTLGAGQIITRDPDVAKYITTLGFSEFERGEAQSVRAGSFLGKGIFNSDGESHKMVRYPHPVEMVT